MMTKVLWVNYSGLKMKNFRYNQKINIPKHGAEFVFDGSYLRQKLHLCVEPET